MSIVILCIDDDHTGLVVRRLLLSTKGYTVLTATSVEVALKLFKCNRIDLVISDHWLPDGTGARLTSQMKRLEPKVPVVLLTAWASVPPGYDHADRLLSKCMAPEEFLAEIANLLSNHNERTKPARASNPSPLAA